MSKTPHHRKDESAVGVTENASEPFVDGQVAHAPFPDQRVRATFAAPHPRKRDVNRDFDVLPRGRLATD